MFSSILKKILFSTVILTVKTSWALPLPDDFDEDERVHIPYELDQVDSIYATQEVPVIKELAKKIKQDSAGKDEEKSKTPKELDQVNSVYAIQEVPKIKIKNKKRVVNHPRGANQQELINPDANPREGGSGNASGSGQTGATGAPR